MFGISMPELILILAIALIVVGPEKLPEIATKIGRIINEFKKTASDFKDSFDVDDEVSVVKKPFDDVSNDIKEIVDVKSSGTKGSGDDHTQKIDDPVKGTITGKGNEAESPYKKEGTTGSE
jgi:Tat protein translocase TatB subunit